MQGLLSYQVFKGDHKKTREREIINFRPPTNREKKSKLTGVFAVFVLTFRRALVLFCDGGSFSLSLCDEVYIKFFSAALALLFPHT